MVVMKVNSSLWIMDYGFTLLLKVEAYYYTTTKQRFPLFKVQDIPYLIFKLFQFHRIGIPIRQKKIRLESD